MAASPTSDSKSHNSVTHSPSTSSSPTTSATAAQRRPMSAPKSSDVSAIPRIVLDGDAHDVTFTSGPAVNGPGGGGGLKLAGPRPASGLEFGQGRVELVGPSLESDHPEHLYYNQHQRPHHDYVPHRCNSDIGLPTASMPNLSLAMALGGVGGVVGNGGTAGGGPGGDKLGVYCSPRTTRRSVDLDLVPRGEGLGGGGRQDYSEWLEERSTSLRVLSAGSRVGSAVSLTSVCTAHSVGLLSNDSDDEFQDASLHDGSSSISGSGVCLTAAGAGSGGGGGSGALASERAGQLRRLQSYPEEPDKSAVGPEGAGISPRTSYSLCNLKAAQQPPAGASLEQGQLTPEKLCMLPSDLDEADDRVLPPGEDGGRGGVGLAGREGKVRGHREGAGEEGRSKAHIVSYGKGSQSMREGRIRRWLQDIDKTTD